MIETAYAKLNLALHVRAREPDGYHRLETVFAFCADGDQLTLEATPGLRLSGEFAGALQGEGDNLILRAERAFRAAFGGEEAGFALAKCLPVAAGIGGGSADAAAALRLLARRAAIALDEPRLYSIAASLGADVPACLRSVAMRGEGRGDVLAALPPGALAGTPVLLINPRVPLATGPVFAGWDRVDHGGLGNGDPLAAARRDRNDLEPPARALVPVIGDVIDHLARQVGVTLARMSGSGATCFALFDDGASRDAAEATTAADHPGWWRLATTLRG